MHRLSCWTWTGCWLVTLYSCWPISVAAETEVTTPTSYEVIVEGLSKAHKPNAMAFLTLHQRRDQPYPGVARVREWATLGEQEIRQALQPFGYYRPIITMTMTEQAGQWEVRYTVELGEPVLVTRLVLDLDGPGETDPLLQAALTDFPLQHGAPLDHGLYENGISGILSAAQARGYFDAKTTERKIEVFPEPYAAKVTVRVETGRRYRLGAVRFAQQEPILREALLRRFVNYTPGDFYQTSTLVAFQDGLIGSEYYDVVDILPQLDQADDDLYTPIEVTLVPNERHRFQVGVGYGTDTGPRTRIDWSVRRLNKRGHRLRTEAGMSFVRQGLSSRYEIPGKQAATDHYYINPRFERTITDTAESKATALNVGYTRRRGLWTRNLFLEATREVFDVGGTSRHGFFLIPGVNWSRKNSNDPLFPTRGSHLFVELKGSSTAVGADTTFIQATVQGKLIRALFSERHRLLARAQLGATEVTDFQRLPPSLRFFSGGDHSVRGYRYQSLGPVDADGERTGGRHIVVGSLEYDFRIFDKFSIAGFIDYGNALNNFSDDRHTSAGGGIRWLSPIGPIRLDFAHGFDRDVGDTQLFHLIIGPDL